MKKSDPTLTYKKSGFTLTELSIVVGVIGLVMGAVWVAANNMHESRRVEVGTNEIVTIAHNVRELYAERGDMSQQAGQSEVSTLVQNAGVFPGEMFQSSTSTLVNPWGGMVLLWIHPSDHPTNTFRISFYSMSQTGCADIASSVGASGAASGLTGFGSWHQTTNAQGQTIPYSVANYTSIQPGDTIDPAAVATACTGSVDGTVSAEFDFSFE